LEESGPEVVSVPVVELNAVQVLAISAFGLVLGHWLKKVFPFLDRVNIPGSIVGGLVYAVVILLLRDRVLNLKMDLVLRDIFMVAFFTCIGLGASLSLVKKGGPQVLLFLGVATLTVVLQNALGVGLAFVFGLNPLIGLLGGSVALVGGPGTALAFGRTFQQLGVSGAETVGLGAAMFGIVAGGLMSGYVGGRIIEKKNLRPDGERTPADEFRTAKNLAYIPDGEALETVTPMSSEQEQEESRLVENVIVLAVAMGLGTLVSKGLAQLGLTLPIYVGAMIAAAVIRNVDDRFRKFGIDQRLLDTIGNISLNIFIVMALLTLELWTLASLALPMLVILAAQVAMMFFLARYLVFVVMGRDYDAAVMACGYCGFGLGTTANALAGMEVLAKKYGYAPRAFLVIPIVGAFLIDFTNALLISGTADFLHRVLVK
jgi:glutamate:Na+ symporter, ESS family